MTIYDEKLKRAAQARKIAEALSQAQSPDGSMVSGHYVSPGWAKQLAYGIDKYQGARGMNEADAMESAANTEKNTAVDDWMKSMPQSQPERQAPIYNSGANQLIANALKGQSTTDMPQPQQTGSQTIPAQPVTPEQRMAWILKGNSIDKDSASLGAKYLEIEQAREAAKDTALHAESDKKEQRDLEKNKPHWMMVEDSSGQHIVNANDQNTPRNFGLKPKGDGGKGDAADSSIPLTDNAISAAAARYNIDGTLPPMGMGKNGALGRARILNKAAEVYMAGGGDVNSQRPQQMANKANATSLAQIQKQETMVSAFEKNANANAEMALNLSDQVDRTGSPIINSWIQAGQKAGTGNPKLSQFHAANETFVNEYAKIMSGSMGNTAVSDSARQHAHSILGTAQTKEQYKAVMSTLKAEMKNRMQGFKDEKAALQSSFSSNPKTETSDPLGLR